MWAQKLYPVVAAVGGLLGQSISAVWHACFFWECVTKEGFPAHTTIGLPVKRIADVTGKTIWNSGITSPTSFWTHRTLFHWIAQRVGSLEALRCGQEHSFEDVRNEAQQVIAQ